MKKLILSAIIVLAGTFSVSAAAKAAPAKAAPEAAKAAPAKAASCEQLRPLDQWTFFQVAFLPYVPNAQMNSNVYGIKSGWPVTCGYGRVFGLEASWIYSGTNHIKGIQASWICNNNESCDGIQASFVVSINRRLMRGLQATMVYTHYRYTRKTDFNRGSTILAAGQEAADGSVLQGINRPRRTAIKL